MSTRTALISWQMRFLALIVTCAGVLRIGALAEEPSAAEHEAEFLTNIRQLTFEGRRAGEGYFSADGNKLCFQSEREPGNPFFQIYVLDLTTGDSNRISPGIGKTTCSWIHPDGNRVLFASTHDDPNAKRKQQEELAQRAAGKERRYAWDYDEYFELYLCDLAKDTMQRLTHTKGYDAEGSISPDGQWIVFASNRHAYETELNESDQEEFKQDPSVQVELYRMRVDGSELQRLTTKPGYDGGPFFDSTGQQLCFRRFAENGATAEILTMDVDGTNERQLTRMGMMSWAPYFHPSGEYLIFTTNQQGFANFELYLVAATGQSEPLRVTFTDGFDGLASFSADGKQLTWTSNRTSSNQSQIFLANWDHQAARKRLGLSTPGAVAAAAHDSVAAVDVPVESDARREADTSFRATELQITPLDLIRHVEFLCRPELEGRLSGSPGEQLATAYVATFLERTGLLPAGDDGSFFQTFEFTAGVDLGPDNFLADDHRDYIVDQDWRPLAFSETGTIDAAPIVFAGYGLVAPGQDNLPEYDSYVHLDVKGKWVLAFRFLPEDVPAETRQHWHRFASLRYKAMVARDRGARGLILVAGPTPKVRSPLVRLEFDGSLGDSGLPVISVTNELAARWLATAGIDLAARQKELDQGEPQMGLQLPEVHLRAKIDINKVRKQGRNVLARLVTTSRPQENTERELVVLGAHVDHLGRGGGGSSLARDDEQGQVHFGADDNASGVAGVLEIAQYLAAERDRGALQGRRDILIAAWSGEELGLLGSAHFAKQWQATAGDSEEPTEQLYPAIAACVNLDMIGRMDKRLVLQGIGSSSIWRSEIERRNVPLGLPVVLQDDGYLPTDASTFYTRGVPILSAFTGSHSDYHTPRDTPEKLDYENAARITRLLAMITRSLVERADIPDFIAPQQSQPAQRRAHLRAYLGSIPDYAESEVSGVRLSGVAANGPAAKAGVKAGDVIIELAGQKITNIYDYTFAIEGLKIDEPVKIVVKRGEETHSFEVTPGSRE